MTTVVSIVEGDGEVVALPVMLRRLSSWLSPEKHIDVAPPIRVKRNRFLNRDEEFQRVLKLAALKCEADGWILILLDADDDCPSDHGQKILRRAQQTVMHRRISVVLANREYEAWFIAAAASLHGRRGFLNDVPEHREPESIRGAKEWLSARIHEGQYREVSDQPAFSASIDLQLAQKNSRSFRKLCTEWMKNMAPDARI